MTRVLVTGMGIISALGQGCKAHHQALQKGQTGIGTAEWVDSRYTQIFPFGEVKASTDQLMAALDIDPNSGLTRTDALAQAAVAEALAQAQLAPSQLQNTETALLSASTVGGMSMTQALYNDTNKIGPPSIYLSHYVCGAHALNLIRHYGIKGPTTTLNTACSSSANAIMMGARLIKAGRIKRAIVGGSDSMAKFTINGFNALRILSPNPCRPFDADRSGLTLGEGAAYLVLEAESEVNNRKVYGEVSGYGNANDAFHPSSISDEAIGVVKAIDQALQIADLPASAIDYINAHGTGTENNDQAELTGLHQLFDTLPPFHSTKSYTGHTLAAAGSVEAVISLLSMQHQELYPSLNYKTPIANFNVAPIEQYQANYPIRHLLSNSFGFGGNCSALIFSRP